MFTIVRELNEGIVIGDNIKVVIISIEGNNRVRIGIDAPKEINIHREESTKRNNDDTNR